MSGAPQAGKPAGGPRRTLRMTEADEAPAAEAAGQAEALAEWPAAPALDDLVVTSVRRPGRTLDHRGRLEMTPTDSVHGQRRIRRRRPILAHAPPQALAAAADPWR